MVDTLVEKLQERVRSSPIPVTWSMCQEQEKVVMTQVANIRTGDVLAKMEMFLSAYIVGQNLGKVLCYSFLICQVEKNFLKPFTKKNEIKFVLFF